QDAYDRAWADFLASCDELFIIQQAVDTAVGILIIVLSSVISGAVAGSIAGPWGAIIGSAVGFVVSTVAYIIYGEASEDIFGALQAQKARNAAKGQDVYHLRDIDETSGGSWEPYEWIPQAATGSVTHVSSGASDYYAVDFHLPTLTYHAYSASVSKKASSSSYDLYNYRLTTNRVNVFGNGDASIRWRHEIYDAWMGTGDDGTIALAPRVRYAGDSIAEVSHPGNAPPYILAENEFEWTSGPVDTTTTNRSVVYGALPSGDRTVTFTWSLRIKDGLAWDTFHSLATCEYYLEFPMLHVNGGLPGVTYTSSRPTRSGSSHALTFTVTFTIKPWSPCRIDTSAMKAAWEIDRDSGVPANETTPWPDTNGDGVNDTAVYGNRILYIHAPVSEMAAVETWIARGSRARLSTLVPTVDENGLVGYTIAPASPTTPDLHDAGGRAALMSQYGGISVPWYEMSDGAPQYQVGYEILALASRYQEAYARAATDSPIAWQWTAFNYGVQAISVAITVIATHGILSNIKMPFKVPLKGGGYGTADIPLQQPWGTKVDFFQLAADGTTVEMVPKVAGTAWQKFTSNVLVAGIGEVVQEVIEEL
ncbi:MAG: hypothetical protein GYA24_14695, partial [Candidatus Lokiarchaeota archaeon]|nr:hypothetical protein [Candidatus Lokiarchaeota archaeon]